MDVYLVPVSAARYALYCEVSLPAVDGEEPSASFFDRLKTKFRRAVAESEVNPRADVEDGRSRIRRYITRKIAETIAEQRLLWHLRHETAARLWHPDTLDGDRALVLARAEFNGDYARHRRWLVIDALLVAVTGPLLFFIPGPNLVSWFFTFRAIGHFFSMRGASRALTVIAWTPIASAHLTDVAAALELEPDERAVRVGRAATALGLDRLVPFIDRVGDRSS